MNSEGFPRKFTVHFHYVGWDCVSLGVSIELSGPNISIHTPCGFFCIGWVFTPFKMRFGLGRIGKNWSFGLMDFELQDWISK